MSRDSSRKPSGSSTHSGAHSPTTSPTNPHSNRRVTPTTTGNMLSVGVSGSSSLMGYNSGWQVWGSGSPSSRRNPSISSVTSGNDLPPSQSEASYRGSLREGWSSSRPASGTWDDEVGHSPHTNDFSQLEPQASLNLHSSRSRSGQASSFSGARVDNRSSKLSPQRYDHSLSKESGSSRYNPTASPTAQFVTSTYNGPQPGIQPPVSNVSGGYDALQGPSTVDELSLSIRGMAVEDDFNVNRQQSSHQMASNQPPRPPPMSQPRAPYGSYTGYYPTSGRDSYADYSYGYATPTDPSIYGSPALANAATANLYPSVAPQGLLPAAVTDLHRQQPNLFYDYGPTRPPGSQYYYPAHQAILYPAPSPMATSQMPNAIATTMDKKREISYNIQQQLLAQNMVFGPMRSTPSPLSQGFPSTMDYSQVPLVMPGASVYGPSMQALQMFPHALRQGRRDGRDVSVSLRSPILDEFRANKSRNWELRDIFGYVVEFSGDQHGSRFIQQKLETASSDEKQNVFDEIVPDNTLQLIQDVFGNYVIQKVFEHGTQVQKTRLASGMEGHILALSLQMYGCRVVQKAIEFILPDQQAAFVRELEPHIMKCVRDANGNHVIQKILERVSPDRLSFVRTFRGSVHELATHPYGCRVLQRSLEHLPEEMIAPLLEELHKSTIALMQDQFGNYVIQFILEHGRPHDRALVIAKLRGQLLQMARHKFASNVCEKALTSADPDTRRLLVDEIITPKYEGLTPVVSMMKDQFANYVLQRAVVVADPEQKEILISQIRPQLTAMRRYSNAYSKHLVSIERLIEKYSPPPQPVAIMPPELVP